MALRQNVLMTLAAALLLGGCGASRYDEYPPYEGAGFDERGTTEKERLIARSDFSVELVRLADNRNPRTEANDPGDNKIYQYDPEVLMQGLSSRLPVLFNKYLTYRPRMAKHYKAEIEITRFKTQILNGTLLSGEFGRYAVAFEARVVARRADSTVAINRPYSVVIEQRRRTYNGRSPSAEMDRTRMYDIAEDAVRQMSQEIGWDLRRTDAHVWTPDVVSGTIPPAIFTVPSPSEPPVIDWQG